MGRRDREHSGTGNIKDAAHGNGNAALRVLTDKALAPGMGMDWRK
jgi:hypothetical protein